MAPDLHPLISGFVEASNARDTDGLLALFSDDAVVRDEGNEYRGIDRIRAWRADVEAKYTFTTTPREVVERGDETVTDRVARRRLSRQSRRPRTPLHPRGRPDHGPDHPALNARRCRARCREPSTVGPELSKERPAHGDCRRLSVHGRPVVDDHLLLLGDLDLDRDHGPDGRVSPSRHRRLGQGSVDDLRGDPAVARSA